MPRSTRSSQFKCHESTSNFQLQRTSARALVSLVPRSLRRRAEAAELWSVGRLMNARISAVAVLLLVSVSAAASDPFRIAVVPTSSQAALQTIETSSTHLRTFFVVLTNISAERQPVWETWNSWGYRSISFELSLPDGTRRIVTKKQQGFTKNFPSTFSIPPGGQQVYPIRLDSSWDSLPAFPSTGETTVTLKAIYEVAASKEAGDSHVWIGRVASPSCTLTLRHW
jgi:hypothetical protein